MAGKASFIPPVIEDNPDGWGPCSIPTAFKDIPYQPFSKGDRLGKVKPSLARFLYCRKNWENQLENYATLIFGFCRIT